MTPTTYLWFRSWVRLRPANFAAKVIGRRSYGAAPPVAEHTAAGRGDAHHALEVVVLVSERNRANILQQQDECKKKVTNITSRTRSPHRMPRKTV